MLPASLFVLDREFLSLASHYTESGRPCQEPKDVKTYIDQQLCKCYMNSFQPRTSHSLQSFRIASTSRSRFYLAVMNGFYVCNILKTRRNMPKHLGKLGWLLNEVLNLRNFFRLTLVSLQEMSVLFADQCSWKRRSQGLSRSPRPWHRLAAGVWSASMAFQQQAGGGGRA